MRLLIAAHLFFIAATILIVTAVRADPITAGPACKLTWGAPKVAVTVELGGCNERMYSFWQCQTPNPL